MRCHRKILRLPYKGLLSNRKSIPRSSRQSWRDANCGCMDMPPVHQVWPKLPCKAQWKGRRQGRQGMDRPLEFGKSQRAVENREKWRKLIEKSSVVPQRPSRLWDRWRVKVRHLPEVIQLHFRSHIAFGCWNSIVWPRLVVCTSSCKLLDWRTDNLPINLGILLTE